MLDTLNPKIEEPLTPLLRVDASPAYLNGAWLFSHGKGSAVPLRQNFVALYAAAFKKELQVCRRERTGLAAMSPDYTGRPLIRWLGR